MSTVWISKLVMSQFWTVRIHVPVRISFHPKYLSLCQCCNLKATTLPLIAILFPWFAASLMQCHLLEFILTWPPWNPFPNIRLNYDFFFQLKMAKFSPNSNPWWLISVLFGVTYNAYNLYNGAASDLLWWYFCSLAQPLHLLPPSFSCISHTFSALFALQKQTKPIFTQYSNNALSQSELTASAKCS